MLMQSGGGGEGGVLQYVSVCEDKGARFPLRKGNEDRYNGGE